MVTIDYFCGVLLSFNMAIYIWFYIIGTWFENKEVSLFFILLGSYITHWLLCWSNGRTFWKAKKRFSWFYSIYFWFSFFISSSYTKIVFLRVNTNFYLNQEFKYVILEQKMKLKIKSRIIQQFKRNLLQWPKKQRTFVFECLQWRQGTFKTFRFHFYGWRLTWLHLCSIRHRWHLRH